MSPKAKPAGQRPVASEERIWTGMTAVSQKGWSESQRPHTLVGCLLLSHALLIVAVSPRKGADSLAMVAFQAGLATLSFIFLLAANRCKNKRTCDLALWQQRLGAVLVCSGLLFTIFGSTGYGERREILFPFRFACLPLMMVYFLANKPAGRSLLGFVYRSRRTIFWVLCVMAVALRVAAIHVSPQPTIDVFWFTNQGAQGLLQGINPYDRAYHVIDPVSEYLYAYLPAQFLFDVPSVALFGDMRWGQIVLELVTAWLLYRLVMGSGKSDFRKHSAELVTLLLLFFPQVLRMHEQCWVEFKQVFAIAASVFVLSRTSGGTYAWLFLGVLFSLKQTTWAALPFLRRVPGFGARSLAVLACTAALIILPFVVWNHAAFYDDIIGYHLNLPLPRSISLSRLVELATGIRPGLIWVILAGGLVWVFLWRSRQSELMGFLLASTALSMLPVLIRQAHLNYYYYVDGMLLTTMAWSLRQYHDMDDGVDTYHTLGDGASARRGG